MKIRTNSKISKTLLCKTLTVHTNLPFMLLFGEYLTKLTIKTFLAGTTSFVLKIIQSILLIVLQTQFSNDILE